MPVARRRIEAKLFILKYVYGTRAHSTRQIKFICAAIKPKEKFCWKNLHTMSTQDVVCFFFVNYSENSANSKGYQTPTDHPPIWNEAECIFFFGVWIISLFLCIVLSYEIMTHLCVWLTCLGVLATVVFVVVRCRRTKKTIRRQKQVLYVQLIYLHSNYEMGVWKMCVPKN